MRPLQQSQAALQRQDAARRELVARRDVGHSQLVAPHLRSTGQQAGNQALRIGGGAHQLCTLGFKNLGRAGVVGFFHQHRVASVKQHAGRKVDALLRAIDDDDLVS